MSSKKPFDHIEDKIKQAAENNLPAFDEKAWQLMEAKLDKEDKKRRPFLWWFVLPLLLAAGWGGYQVLKPAGDNIAQQKIIKKGNDSQEDNVMANLNREKIEMVDENKSKITVTVPGDVDKEDAISTESNYNKSLSGSVSKKVRDKSIGDNKLFNAKKIKGAGKGKTHSQFSGGAIDDLIAEKNEIINDTDNIVKAIENKKDDEYVSNGKKDTTTDKVILDNKKTIEEPNTDDKKTLATNEKAKPEKKKEEKDKKSNKGFYVLATGGADAAGTKLLSFSNSDIEPKYGMGVGYQFNNRVSIQTGFYIANKKYNVSPDDYIIKPGSAMAAYRIDKIKAACQVYEIPLAIKYNVVSKKSLIFYAMAGMSSYILKKEKYDCFYNYYGTEYEKEWLYSGNKHFFSIANFSIGIERKISSHFSLLAEPSLSVPVSGVGDGKIKLYSTSLQLGLKYYLFKKQ